MSDPAETLSSAREKLLSMRAGGGWWEGRLSPSALSTAAAVTALAVAGGEDHPGAPGLVDRGLAWLADHVNADGGWGDTPQSQSTLPATLLVWSALAASEAEARFPRAGAGARDWLVRRIGGLDPDHIAAAVIDTYGADRTFAVPILTMCAISGRLGPDDAAWRRVPSLPFELAALPHWSFRLLGLPVVSYALPALIAIGQARHHHRATRNPLARAARILTRRHTLRKLRAIQPAGGGFLEAAPLTAFVAMSLATAGHHDHPVTGGCIKFLVASARDDGSWPIDTHLATWVTTLSVNALGNALHPRQRGAIRAWLLDQQYRQRHPYTAAAPGGWAWTPLSGGVPDADDTAGALLALRNLGDVDDRTRSAAADGVEWLIGLQNRDGGIPTFCRGWGKLQFDRSCPDLTAHAVSAWQAWREDLPAKLAGQAGRAVEKAVAYLARSQRGDGAWVPLWFGNDSAPRQENPTYGTARVLLGLADAADAPAAGETISRGAAWLASARNGDGGWGGAPGTPSSIEETALAVDALAKVRHEGADLARGVAWLVARTDGGRSFPPAPIGLYFARLWYSEDLYPVIFTVSALNRFLANAPSHPDNQERSITRE